MMMTTMRREPAAARANHEPGRSRRHGALLLLAVQFALVQSPAWADSDERTVVGNTTAYPWKDVVKVRIGSTGGGRGSAVMVASCVALTAGHVVYNHGSGAWQYIYNIAPASYYSETSNATINPYGTKSPITL